MTRQHSILQERERGGDMYDNWLPVILRVLRARHNSQCYREVKRERGGERRRRKGVVFVHVTRCWVKMKWKWMKMKWNEPGRQSSMEPTKQYWLKKEGVCRGGARIVPNQRSYCFRCHFCHAKNVPRESEITRAFPFLFSNGSRAISMRTLCHAGKFYGCRNQNCLCWQCIAIKC